MTTRDLVKVNVSLRIYSSVPGQGGSWTIDRDFVLHGVPRAGEDIELEDGWASHAVARVTWCGDGVISISLEPTKTDSAEILAELKQLVDDYGWSQSGGPW